jgi:pyrroloquinoline quinone biosynthesis protein B
LKIRVLGSAAGGGFPQWNCGCFNCREGRRLAAAPSRGRRSRSRQRRRRILVPDQRVAEIRAQIEACPELWPTAERHSPIAGILLTNGDMDHCLGLLSLRESHPLVVYATDAVRAGFTEATSSTGRWSVSPGR